MRAWKLLLFTTLPLWVGCVFSRDVVTLPADDALVRDQLVIHSDFALPRHHRLVEDLVARRGDVVEQLRLPASDEPIHVYLFDSSERFRRFMTRHHPEFPDRRAFFVEGDTELNIYAYWGDRVAEDLRHEVTHGYLHTMVPHLPLWLDEGLAEYFEVPRGRAGTQSTTSRHVTAGRPAAALEAGHSTARRIDEPEQHDSAGLCGGVGLGPLAADQYAPTQRPVAELLGAHPHDRRGTTAVPGPVDGRPAIGRNAAVAPAGAHGCPKHAVERERRTDPSVLRVTPCR